MSEPKPRVLFSMKKKKNTHFFWVRVLTILNIPEILGNNSGPMLQSYDDNGLIVSGFSTGFNFPAGLVVQPISSALLCHPGCPCQQGSQSNGREDRRCLVGCSRCCRCPARLLQPLCFNACQPDSVPQHLLLCLMTCSTLKTVIHI